MDPSNDLDFALTMIACSLESQIRSNLENLTDGARFGQIVRSNTIFPSPLRLSFALYYSWIVQNKTLKESNLLRVIQKKRVVQYWHITDILVNEQLDMKENTDETVPTQQTSITQYFSVILWLSRVSDSVLNVEHTKSLQSTQMKSSPHGNENEMVKWFSYWVKR